MRTATLFFLLFGLLGAQKLGAQIMTNKGQTVYISPGAQMRVSGELANEDTLINEGLLRSDAMSNWQFIRNTGTIENGPLMHHAGYLLNNTASWQNTDTVFWAGDSVRNMGGSLFFSDPAGSVHLIDSSCQVFNGLSDSILAGVSGGSLKLTQSGQLHNEGLVTVPDTLQHAGQLVTNMGRMTITGLLDNTDTLFNDDLIVAGSGTSNAPFRNAGTLQLSGDWQESGTYYPDTGTIEMTNGAPAQFNHGSRNIYQLTMNGSGGINLQDTVVVGHQLQLTDGVLKSSNSAILRLTASATQTGGGPASHVFGPMVRKGASSLAYPLGDSTNFRPLILENIQSSAIAPVLKFELLANPGAASAGRGLQSVSGVRAWRGELLSGDYNGAKIRLGISSDDLSDLSKGVVTQSGNLNGTYRSIGNGGTTGTLPGTPDADSTASLTSAFFGRRAFYRVGSAENTKLKVSAFLQGAFDQATPTEMDTLPIAVLDTFEMGAGGTFPKMLPGYSVPSGAVDVLSLKLRSTATGTAVDSGMVWLMKDGSIRDFSSGTQDFLTFAQANPDDYFVVLEHRNHLSAMSATNQSLGQSIPTASDVVDFTQIANVYGAGEILLGSGTYGLIGGNAQNTNQTVDANDFFQVSFANDQGVGFLDPVYDSRDVKLSGAVNAQDFNLASNNNDFGYFSTVP